MKALFKKLTGSPHHPDSFLESQSDSDLPVKKTPLTPTQVRRIMHASLEVQHQHSISPSASEEVDGAYSGRRKHHRTSTEGDIGHFTRHTHVYYKHRARARPVLSRTNDSDSDIVTPYNKNLSVSSAFTHGSGIHESRSMEDLLKFSDSEKVQHKWRGYHKQVSESPAEPDIDSEQIRRELQNPVRALYSPRNTEYLVAVLDRSDFDVNTLDKKTGEAPLHALIKKERKDRVKLVLLMLVHSDADVNLETSRGATPLHLAVEAKDVRLVKILLAFGANMNHQGLNDFTPLDLAMHTQCPEVERVLLDHGAKGSVCLIAQRQRLFSVVPPLHSLDEQRPPPGHGQRLRTSDKLQEYIQRRGTDKLYRELENYVNQRLSVSLRFGRDGADEMMAMAQQQKEMTQYNQTMKMVYMYIL
jgi:hypothetical protein